MSKNLIKKYSTSVIKDFIERANDLKELKHELTKGELKELFVSRVLKSFLPSQFDIGSGIVVNGVAEQSCQTDIIIYDNRIVPPFIREQNMGVYPVHSVIATVEIKTKLNKKELMEAEDAAKIIRGEVTGRIVNGYPTPGGLTVALCDPPLCAVFGFEGGVRVLNKPIDGKAFLEKDIEHLKLICITGKYCWAKVNNEWSQEVHTETYGEVKRFIALLVDNIRHDAQKRFKSLVEHQHWDWLSMYIR